MKEIIKFLGVLLILIGAGIFVAYSQTMGAGNIYLISGLSCVIVGVIAHILLNKFIK